MEYDQNRTTLLQEVGIREIRFSNEAVLGDIAKVLEVIVGVLEEGGIV
jgi:very-short-patch-repair endonuclease